MWWHDIADIKEKLDTLAPILESIHGQQGEIYERWFKGDPLCLLDDKLTELLDDADKMQDILVAEKTMDKFEDYMKNIDKVNSLVNEFKGCVALARGSINEGKELAKEVDGMKGLAAISQQIYSSMMAFIKASENMEQRAHYKIDAIYKEICEYHVRKRRRKRTKKSCSTQST